MLHFILLFLNICFLGNTIHAQSTDLFISVNPDTNMLVDSLGRERFFHGTNVVVKEPPFYPLSSGTGHNVFSEVDMKLLQSLGLNSVRLGMMMPGFVPERGEYNETYIETVGNIVELAAKYGIYTLLDMHQDVFSPKFCVEGMPDWIVNTSGAKPFPWPLPGGPFPNDPETGYPYPEDCAKHPWSSYYFTDAAAKAYQNLYKNVDGLLDAWADFWGKTAQYFRYYSSVVGYELINEPFCGDVFTKPILIVPGVADRLNLQPAYNVLQKAIRQEDDQHNIFFEGVTWDFFKVGFTKVPGGADYQNRSVLSYHYYEPPDFSKTLNFASRMKDLERLKCGGFLTEMYTVGSGFDDMYEMFDLADEHKQSWHGWDYNRPDPLPPTSSKTGKVGKHLSPSKAKKDHNVKTKDTNFQGQDFAVSPKGSSIQVQDTSRTYPQAVAGFTDTYKFDKNTKEFTLSYRTNAACKSRVTEVYFNKVIHYPDGFDHELSPSKGMTLSISEDGFRLLLQHDPGMEAGTLITLSMAPKSSSDQSKEHPIP